MQPFQSTPLFYQRSHSFAALPFTVRLDVSIHSAVLPAEPHRKSERESRPASFQSTPLFYQRSHSTSFQSFSRATRFQSTPLFYQRSHHTLPSHHRAAKGFNPLRCFTSGATPAARVAAEQPGFQSTPLFYQRSHVARDGYRRPDGAVSIHSAVLPAEPQGFGFHKAAIAQVSIHSAVLPAEPPAGGAIGGAVNLGFNPLRCFTSGATTDLLRSSFNGWFQSTPLFYQRSHPEALRARWNERCFNPLRCFTSGATWVGLDTMSEAQVSIHSAVLPAEPPLLRG